MGIESNGKEPRQHLNVTVPVSLKNAVVQKAEDDRRPISWVVEDLLRKALEAEQTQGVTT